MRLRTRPLLAVSIAGLLLAAPAMAAGDDQRRRPGEEGSTPPAVVDELETAARHLVTALELLVRSIPQYEAPEVLENGDIIIRRQRPDEPLPGPTDPDTAETSTEL